MTKIGILFLIFGFTFLSAARAQSPSAYLMRDNLYASELGKFYRAWADELHGATIGSCKFTGVRFDSDKGTLSMSVKIGATTYEYDFSSSIYWTEQGPMKSDFGGWVKSRVNDTQAHQIEVLYTDETRDTIHTIALKTLDLKKNPGFNSGWTITGSRNRIRCSN